MLKNVNYTKIINYLLIGYAFSVPISKAGINIFENLIFLFWILEGKWKEKYELIKKNLVSIAIIAFILLNLIFLPKASSLSFGIDYIFKYRHFLIILVMLTSLKKEYLSYIFSAFLAGMLISEITSYGIFFEWWHYKNVKPTDPSPFMDHIGYSVYLSITSIILLLYILKTDVSLQKKFFYSFFLITVTINLFINGGRTGQVIYLVSILIVFIMSFKSKFKGAILSLILLSAVFVGAYSFSPVFKNRLDYTISDILIMKNSNDYSRSFSKRIALWNIGYHKYVDNPLMGYGIGNDMKNLKYYCNKLNYSYKILKPNVDNHNTFITIALQMGFAGIIAILFILYSLYSLKFKTDYFKILNIVFVTSFILWGMTGIATHTMNGMIYFTLFAGLLNRISYLEMLGEKVALH